MIHRIRHGGAPKGAVAPGRNVVQIGEWFAEYSGPVPNQTDLDAFFSAAPDPATQPLTAEDTERLFRLLGATPAQIAQAKRDRGRPM